MGWFKEYILLPLTTNEHRTHYSLRYVCSKDTKTIKSNRIRSKYINIISILYTVYCIGYKHYLYNTTIISQDTNTYIYINIIYTLIKRMHYSKTACRAPKTKV